MSTLRAHPIPEAALDQALRGEKLKGSSHVFNADLKQAWGCLLSVIARRANGPSPEEAVSAAYYLVLQVNEGFLPSSTPCSSPWPRKMA
jgi:hypothetical protein